MIFRQLFDQTSGTYTYILADDDSKEALIIDPVFEQHLRDAALITELELGLSYTLDTHVHADHVTGSWLLKEQFGCRIAMSAVSGAEGLDLPLVHGQELRFGRHRLEARATPGHTNGCMSFVVADAAVAFTGDALLIRGAGRTDFQEGNAATLFRSVRDRIFNLPDSTLLYPAHDYNGRTVTSVAEEKRFNPRLGTERSLEDFVGYMDNLGLPHPKQIEVALPANLRCGRPTEERPASAAVQRAASWAPVFRNFAGIPEIEPLWLAEHLTEVTIVDVREPGEFVGELGHIPGARSIPLGSLTAHLAELDPEQSTVTVCRSGARSARAALLLEQHHFARVANLAGGMMRWGASGFPYER